MGQIFGTLFYTTWKEKPRQYCTAVYLLQQCKQNIQFQHNKFNKARQPEGQMPIMLATYSTNEVSDMMC